MPLRRGVRQNVYRSFVFLALTISGFLLSACAQDPNSVVISVGRGLNMPNDGAPADGNEVRDFAAFYLPYARMARLAYADEPYLVRANGGCPVLSKLTKRELASNEEQYQKHLDLDSHFRALSATGWRCVDGWFGAVPYDRVAHNPAPGLAVYLWKRQSRGRCELAVAFRGTDSGDIHDWKANLRGLLPFSGTKDQYDSVKDSIRTIVERGRCGNPKVVMVGHSLGAGLAQAAAYANPRTSYVFAFDSSPVTTWREQGARVLAEGEYLAVDRVYEVGEILQAVRYVLHGFSNPRVCQPRTRLVRFNFMAGWNPLGQHSMEELTRNLAARSVRVPGKRDPIPGNADGTKKAMDCDYRDEFRD